MATDGLWDVVKNSEARNIVKEVLSSQKSKEYEDSPEEIVQAIAR